MCSFYRNTKTMGDALSPQSNQFFQLYVYIIPIMCSIRSGAILALYTHDERPRETIGTRYDMEKSVYGFGLGILSNCLEKNTIVIQLYFL